VCHISSCTALLPTRKFYRMFARAFANVSWSFHARCSTARTGQGPGLRGHITEKNKLASPKPPLTLLGPYTPTVGELDMMTGEADTVLRDIKGFLLTPKLLTKSLKLFPFSTLTVLALNCCDW
jgi:hypothetical protein